MTVPVAMVALFQWGLTPEFTWLMVVYTVIQVLTGNVLEPILFSEALNLHPVAIIIAVLVFGGLWGFWGSSSPFPRHPGQGGAQRLAQARRAARLDQIVR